MNNKNLVGKEGYAETTVTNTNCADYVKSGSLQVFSTPMMIALIEEASVNALAPYLDDEETTVGTYINVYHLSATPLNIKVTAKAVITSIIEKEIVFEISASDEKGLIGKGEHKRFLVNSKRFLEKTNSKFNN
jgi:fluoroacetyl-CoA thioesterase